jgi:hypothetical protein
MYIIDISSYVMKRQEVHVDRMGKDMWPYNYRPAARTVKGKARGHWEEDVEVGTAVKLPNQ